MEALQMQAACHLAKLLLECLILCTDGKLQSMSRLARTCRRFYGMLSEELDRQARKRAGETTRVICMGAGLDPYAITLTSESKKARATYYAQPFYDAVRLGDYASVRAFLKAGASADFSLGSKGGPMLYVASLYGHLDMVRLLLEHGASPNVDFRLTNSTPCLAYRQWYPAKMYYHELEKHRHPYSDWSPREPRRGWIFENNLLCQAIRHGDPNVVHLLLEYGANPNAVEYRGYRDAGPAEMQPWHKDKLDMLTAVDITSGFLYHPLDFAKECIPVLHQCYRIQKKYTRIIEMLFVHGAMLSSWYVLDTLCFLPDTDVMRRCLRQAIRNGTDVVTVALGPNHNYTENLANTLRWAPRENLELLFDLVPDLATAEPRQHRSLDLQPSSKWSDDDFEDESAYARNEHPADQPLSWPTLFDLVLRTNRQEVALSLIRRGCRLSPDRQLNEAARKEWLEVVELLLPLVVEEVWCSSLLGSDVIKLAKQRIEARSPKSSQDECAWDCACEGPDWQADVIFEISESESE
ncbi:ankyrin [Aspergillus saccharolyticus JOP 1030-1]|uniref:Ankyrin n=1 Tax=Aspergillus saccharolyticus JOP 1030-1 TaxID=1450539 RepID=A0A318ZL13_9EURO|nr:ankyrin [Aspergillus saccharolyticus JOP 1030-1]PYH47094.1 ankyrin [Aspergillus saccharolyticus JOP 1030-1]